jgi:hypothetical protein
MAASLLTANHPIDDLSYYTKVVSECSTNFVGCHFGCITASNKAIVDTLPHHTSTIPFLFWSSYAAVPFSFCKLLFWLSPIDSMLPFVPKLSQRVWIVGR